MLCELIPCKNWYLLCNWTPITALIGGSISVTKSIRDLVGCMNLIPSVRVVFILVVLLCFFAVLFFWTQIVRSRRGISIIIAITSSVIPSSTSPFVLPPAIFPSLFWPISWFVTPRAFLRTSPISASLSTLRSRLFLLWNHAYQDSRTLIKPLICDLLTSLEHPSLYPALFFCCSFCDDLLDSFRLSLVFLILIWTLVNDLFVTSFL